jgi:hypothetical protein
MKHVMMAVALMGIVLAGCSKSVQLTVMNTADRPLPVEIHGQGEGVGYLGDVPANGEIRTVIKVRKKYLPASYTCKAGPYSEPFTLTKDTRDRISLEVPGDTPGSGISDASNYRKTGKESPIVYHP